MRFGVFSNGFRPHTSAGETYNEDIREIVLAEQLGFEDAYISEHHGELPYIGRVDTIPTPDLLMCKIAGMTSKIRLGAAVKLIHLHHPVDVAIQAAVTEHLLGAGRYIFGFGTGFGNPLFSHERGLSFEDRHARLAESLDAILKCWSSREPFDLDGKYWKGTGIIATPHPCSPQSMPMATATDHEGMVKIAAERGYTLLSAFIETPQRIKAKTERYARFSRDPARAYEKMTVARLVYIADSREEAIEDMRAGVAHEVSVQAERGFLKMLKANFGVEVPNSDKAVDALVDMGLYMVGTPADVTRQLRQFHDDSGGFGTLLIVTGKAWSTREKRERSMRRFMTEVAPKLRDLRPSA